MNYKFITADEFINYLIKNPEKEFGFTSDTLEDIQVSREPEGWYGAKLTKAFDGCAILFGDYGFGIISYRDVIDKNYEFEILKDFFKYEFGRDITRESMICVDSQDFV